MHENARKCTKIHEKCIKTYENALKVYKTKYNDQNNIYTYYSYNTIPIPILLSK